MTTEQAVYRRALRRETHASRTVPAMTVASCLLLLVIATLVAGVWWLVDPAFRAFLAEQIAVLSGWGRTALIAAGMIAVLVALLLLTLAVAPGRRARRARTTERVALLIDDGVLADAVADTVAAHGGIDRRQVSTSVGRRTVTVSITPTSGIPIDRAAAEAAVADTLAGIGFSATPRIVVAPYGVVA